MNSSKERFNSDTVGEYQIHTATAIKGGANASVHSDVGLFLDPIISLQNRAQSNEPRDVGGNASKTTGERDE
jgi:hypothetical protein